MSGISPLTRIKIQELQRQRDRLHAHYQATEERAQAAPDPAERLRVLTDGLRAARFAQTPLHPDVDNLDAVFHQVRMGAAEPELIGQWLRRAEEELRRGRLRAEVAYVFGKILEEAANPDSSPVPAGGPPPAPGQEPWAVIWKPDPPGVDLTLLERLGEENRSYLEDVRQAVRDFGEKDALAPVQDQEVSALLGAIAGDLFRRADQRRQASITRASETLVHEYAGALTVLLANLDEWDWPAEGVEFRPVWNRNKWRAYLDEDLLTLLFLQLVGLRWGMLLKRLCVAKLNTAGDRGSSHLLRFGEPLLFPGGMLESRRTTQAAGLFLPRIPGSLSEWASSRGGYSDYSGGRGGPDALERLLALVETEIRIHRDLHPGGPLFVVQTDLRDFYPSLPHNVAETVCRQFGFPPRWLGFFGRFLRARLRVGEEVRPVRRGLMLDHLLCALFAELLLFWADVHVYQTTGVRLLRVIDDTYFLADSAGKSQRVFQELQGFFHACGLEINPSKSGAVCLTGEPVPEGLPARLPHWGLLELHPDGVWRPDEASAGRVQERMRDDVRGCTAVLDLVVRANDYLAYFLRQLGVRVALDRGHLDRVGQRAVQAFHQLFGPEHGVVGEVRMRIAERFLDARIRELGFPESLFYWPITAGGLGLTHPLVYLAAFDTARRLRGEPAVPSSPLGISHYQPWLNYYDALLAPLQPVLPAETPALEHLLRDFIARGGKVSGKHQASLSCYWQWVVYTYGPAVLDALGTFHFLLTELIPLQLVHQNRSVGRNLGSEPGVRASAYTPPPGTTPTGLIIGDIPF